MTLGYQPNGYISIHSTTRVETPFLGISDEDLQISIHSTTRVETNGNGLLRQVLAISIHSTTRVETIYLSHKA